MPEHPISGWQDHIVAGRQYLNAAGNGRRRPAVFNNELVFQMSAMAIEKLIAGLCQYHRRMPNDHTLTGLVAGLDTVCPMAPKLARRITLLEIRDDMCALSVSHRQPPSDTDIEEILSVGRAVSRFVDSHVPPVRGAKAAQ